MRTAHLILTAIITSAVPLAAQSMSLFRERADTVSGQFKVWRYRSITHPVVKNEATVQGKAHLVLAPPGPESVVYANVDLQVGRDHLVFNHTDEYDPETKNRKETLAVNGHTLVVVIKKETTLYDLFLTGNEKYKQVCLVSSVEKKGHQFIQTRADGARVPAENISIPIFCKLLSNGRVEYLRGSSSKSVTGRPTIFVDGKTRNVESSEYKLKFDFFHTRKIEDSTRESERYKDYGQTLQDFVDLGLVDEGGLQAGRLRESAIVLDFEDKSRVPPENAEVGRLHFGKMLPPLTKGGAAFEYGVMKPLGSVQDQRGVFANGLSLMNADSARGMPRYTGSPLGLVRALNAFDWLHAGMDDRGRVFVNARIPLGPALGVVLVTKYHDEDRARIAYADTSGVVARIDGETIRYGMLKGGTPVPSRDLPEGTPLKARKVFVELFQEYLGSSTRFVGPGKDTYGRTVENQMTLSQELAVPLSFY